MQTTEQTANETVRTVWNKRPLIISGPCSAETEEQVLETAQRLAATGKVDMLRAGIWKPKTNRACLKELVPKDYLVATGKEVDRFANNSGSGNCKTSAGCIDL